MITEKSRRARGADTDAIVAVKVDWVSAHGIRGEISANGDTLSRGNSFLRFFERWGEPRESLESCRTV